MLSKIANPAFWTSRLAQLHQEARSNGAQKSIRTQDGDPGVTGSVPRPAESLARPRGRWASGAWRRCGSGCACSGTGPAACSSPPRCCTEPPSRDCNPTRPIKTLVRPYTETAEGTLAPWDYGIRACAPEVLSWREWFYNIRLHKMYGERTLLSTPFNTLSSIDFQNIQRRRVVSTAW